MKVKVTIDLADKRQASAFQELVSAQAEAAQKPSVPKIIPHDQAMHKYWNETEGLHDEDAPEEAKKAVKEYLDEADAAETANTQEKKKRAPRKTQAIETAPADDTAAAENAEVTDEEVLTPAADAAEEEAPQDPEYVYTEQEVRQLVADKVNEHRAVIKAKLSEWGTQSVTLLPKDKYGELVAFLNKLP